MTRVAAEWYWGEVAASVQDGALCLRHNSDDAELWVRDARLLPGHGYADASRETRRMLARVGAIMRLRARGRYFVHAAGVVDAAGRAFVLAGDSGAGKSTLAFALARLGWGVLGDDGVVLEARAHGVVAHPWRDALRVSPDAFPELRPMVSVASERGMTPADPRCRVRTWANGAKAAPVAAFVFVRRADHARLAPMEPLAALAALVRQSPWVMLGDPVARAHLDALRHAAMSVPALDFAHTRRELLVLGDMFDAWHPPGAARTA